MPLSTLLPYLIYHFRTSQRRQSNTPIPPPQSRQTLAPPGYQPLSVQTAATASQAYRLFQPGNLDGKQLWHITAPASVPISSVTSVALESIKKGEAALTHNGAEYGFVNQGGERKRSRLLVAGEGEGYRAGECRHPVISKLCRHTDTDQRDSVQRLRPLSQPAADRATTLYNQVKQLKRIHIHIHDTNESARKAPAGRSEDAVPASGPARRPQSPGATVVDPRSKGSGIHGLPSTEGSLRRGRGGTPEGEDAEKEEETC